MGIISPVLAAATVVNSKQMGLIERMAPPEDISVNGNLIDWLFAYTTGMNIFFFVLVFNIKIFFFFISTKKIELSDFTQTVPSPNKDFNFQTHSGFEVIIFNLY